MIKRYNVKKGTLRFDISLAFLGGGEGPVSGSFDVLEKAMAKIPELEPPRRGMEYVIKEWRYKGARVWSHDGTTYYPSGNLRTGPYPPPTYSADGMSMRHVGTRPRYPDEKAEGTSHESTTG